jgi:fatty acid-binding protein DegV
MVSTGPHHHSFGEDIYKTISRSMTIAFERIDKEGKLPTTSAPSPGDLRSIPEAFEQDKADT